ncbi:MAG: hypothetical protein KH138_09580 [Firmicutes bacterium]|nr:hypothetical protein [Bacillota bacterium]
MKKILAMLLSLVMMCSCFVITAGAVETQDVDVSPMNAREVLTLSQTQNIYVGNKIAKLTVNYTVRSEPSNTSGYYITGILNASITNVVGWTAVNSATINRSGITYADNHQLATVPITYQGSVGSGYATYSTVITIQLT